MLVQHGLERNADLFPDKTALIHEGRSLTYAELNRAANRRAQALRRAGVRRGDRVAIYLPNSVETVLSVYAALKADAAFVCINRSVKPQKLRYLIGDCAASALITEGGAITPGFLPAMQAADPDLRTLIVTGSEEEASAADPAALSCSAIDRHFPSDPLTTANIDLDLACLIYTSGSTGDAKGVMCDHSNVTFAVESITSYIGNTPSDVVLNALPLSFDYGLYQMLMTFTFGGTLVLQRSFAFPSETLMLIAEHRVTGLPGVPTMFATLVAIDLQAYDLSSLRYLTNTAAALPPAHIQELIRKFPNVAIHSMYGLTETKRTLHLPPDQLRARPGSVGIAIPGTEVWIEGSDGERLGPNETGELVVRGRHVMRGYWNAPELSAARFRAGTLPGERLCYTGDLFRMDEDGFLYFVCRKDDIIKTRGEKVSPREVEDVLHAIPGVKQAAVVGVHHPVLGQAIHAVVVADESRVTVRSILSYCRAHLEDFMVPRTVEFRDSLPTTSSGKVHRAAIAT